MISRGYILFYWFNYFLYETILASLIIQRDKLHKDKLRSWANTYLKKDNANWPLLIDLHALYRRAHEHVDHQSRNKRIQKLKGSYYCSWPYELFLFKKWECWRVWVVSWETRRSFSFKNNYIRDCRRWDPQIGTPPASTNSILKGGQTYLLGLLAKIKCSICS